ncbi:uncharacterized protein LOC106074746 [Biomphalaria glabrata]|uniref:Uncharacterized protein LOC106074746 n=1 Tax=Biomphalaria glabrata TaxID=6526 RepID=A0A9W2ZWD9_BIOGL|nr:uncharacterized protein LOC106074746 [Biomphalaria glabrata]
MPQLIRVSILTIFILICVGQILGLGRIPLTGGYVTQNLDKATFGEIKKFFQVANVAVTRMNEVKTNFGRNNKQGLQLKALTQVKTQVVAGVNYDLEFIVDDEGKTRTCKIIVSHLYPWRNGGKWSIKSSSASDECKKYVSNTKKTRPRRSAGLPLLGGKEPLADDDKALLEVAQWAVEYLNRMSNSIYKKVMVKVGKATKQVVNGYRYEFLVTVTPTTCHNNVENAKKTLKECPAADDAKPQECDVLVFHTNGQYKMDTLECRPAAPSPVIGGGDHDYKPHGIIGGGDHDYKPHGMIGGGDHDYKPHGTNGEGGQDHKNYMIGTGHHGHLRRGMLIGGDHDYRPHENSILGQDTHDYVSHKPDEDQAVKNLKEAIMNFGSRFLKSDNDNVHQMTIVDETKPDIPASVDDLCSQYKTEFENFKSKYNRLYSTIEEESQKFKVFCKNMERVKVLQKTEQGSGQYGATVFADLSEEEFRKQYLGLKPTKTFKQWPMAKIPTDPIPDAWDWRDHGAVSPVKNQGSCGSCWAFSTTGNVEGQWAINGPSHQLLSLSEQELVDCDKIDQGCGGGYMYQAYEAIMEIGGLETETDYKYEGKDDKCRFNSSEVQVKLTGAVNISQDENEMAAWLYKNGPISIGINAFAMQFYMGGISHPWKLFCSPDGLDHGVLIVGYGKKGNEPYWIVKNSWGENWGVKGYYLVYRGDGTCGLNKMCSSATVN